ncbi:uncharacterized protein LOC130712637 [Lotus japonicus]|uniref:uncharacterized protein LOC130712637 n=1 Tax=Lotus japonicus TaxID=34305 RepID=UPI00258F2E08|nr:uncharacterized protein LOC130712637 [Lotus japonicus]
MEKLWACWNVRGLGKASKRHATKMALNKLKPVAIFLQETKINENNVNILEGWARGMDFKAETVPANGSAGGLISMWRHGYFDLISTTKNPRFLGLTVKFPNISEQCLLINVYGPNSEDERGDFFSDLGLLLNNHHGPIAIGGDFNDTP